MPFSSLRSKHPRLVYECFVVEQGADWVEFRYRFILEPGQIFQPTLVIEKPAGDEISPTILRNLAFHIGLIELISYWKAACPAEILIRAGHLSPKQIDWWRKVYFHGLGEFFYTNGLNPKMEDFVSIKSEGPGFAPESIPLRHENLIPVGGGKDSLVTLDLLSAQQSTNRLFFLNATEAQWASAKVTGYERNQIVCAKRTIDPALLELNRQGYLNGHTPFSALLGFIAVTAAALHGKSCVALSNEKSADESTIPGTLINHQWSKSSMFEKMFHDYVQEWLIPKMNYVSVLRAWNELQIARHFTLERNKAGLGAFRSCNVGQKTNSWCGSCPKCLFVNIMLAPFVSREEIRSVFRGTEPLNETGLRPILDQLIGVTENKPFECIGTVEEVRAALSMSSRLPDPPQLVCEFVEAFPGLVQSPEQVGKLLEHGH